MVCGILARGRMTRSFRGLPSPRALAEMKWFLTQEVAGEAGFDDLTALTQVRLAEARKVGTGSQLLGRNGPRKAQGDAWTTS